VRPPEKKIIIFFLGVAACTAPQPPAGAAGPIEAVQEFAAAMQKGDSAAAWQLLSQRTRQEADRLAQAALPDAGSEAGRQMLFQSALPGRPTEAHVLSQSADSAEVQTASDGGTRVFRVLRENGLWRVDLDLQH